MSYRVAHSLQQCALGTCQERRDWRPQKWENALYEGSYEGRLTKGCVAVPAVSRGGRAPAPAPGNSRLACAREGVLLPPGARRRAAAFHASRFAFPGLRLTHASPIDPSLLK